MESLKQKYNNSEVLVEYEYTEEQIMELHKQFVVGRAYYDRLWKILEAFDSGEFWSVVGKNIPGYAVKPDTNWINYIKTNYVNSLYTGSYKAMVFPRKRKFMEQTLAINEFIDYQFDKLGIPSLQKLAGGRAALLNFGVLEFGWRSDIIDGPEDLTTGDLEARHLDNLQVYLDPAVTDYLKGRAVFIVEEVPLLGLIAEKRFETRARYYESLFKNEKAETILPNVVVDKYSNTYITDSKDQTVKLITCYLKVAVPGKGIRVDKLWLLNDGFVLDIQKDIKPSEFPIRVLYCEDPVKDCYGTPMTKLIMYNVMTLNILDTVESSLIGSSLRRPKIVARRANLNEKRFSEEGDDPNILWVVDGEPDRVVRYVDLPTLPADRHLLKQRLELAIHKISGVDDRYTGRDTGSVQTTGGMDLMNQRISMTDNGRIECLQKFVVSVTKLIIAFYLEYGGKRAFVKRNASLDDQDIKEINFEDMKKEHVGFDYVCNATPNLPVNAVRLGQVANELMEKQMQYNHQPPLITVEEWLTYQDFPQKYHIFARMKADRLRNDQEEIQADLISYAGLVEEGVRPEQAVNMLASERQLKREQPGLGNTGNTQERQRG